MASKKPPEAKWLISGGGLPNEYAVCNLHYDETLKALRAKGIIRVDAIVDPVDCMAKHLPTIN